MCEIVEVATKLQDEVSTYLRKVNELTERPWAGQQLRWAQWDGGLLKGLFANLLL